MSKIKYIAKIESNIKGMGKASLGYKTLIYGPTGSGKSSIVEAAQLALTGGVYGILLRNKIVRQADQLRTLMPEGGKKLFSRATMSTDGVATWELYPKKKAHRAGESAEAVTVAEVREAFSGSGDRALFFLHRFLQGTKMKSSMLDGFHHGQLRDAIEHLLFDRDDTDLVSLPDLHAEASKHARDEKKRGTFFQDVADLTGNSGYQEEGIRHLRHAQGWKNIAGGLMTLISKEIEEGGGIEALVLQGTQFLPEGERLCVDLSGRVGISFDGRPPIYSLSGSQEARALVVLAAALLEGFCPRPPALLVVEDRMWDPEQLFAMMQALTKSRAQILITSTIKPEEWPDGWTLLPVVV